ncbi:MAG: type II toxin-antitoxin system Phd/YefM family antitoxin [Parvularculaceae bacterium]
MHIFSARTAAKNFGAMLDAADKAPVTINRHGRPRAVMIGWREFQHYQKAYEEAMDLRVLEILRQSVEHLAAGRLGRGEKALALAKKLGLGEIGIDEADAYTEKKGQAPQS